MLSHSGWATIANQIRTYRKKRGLRQRDIVRLIGVRHEPHASEWETGKRIPDLETALRLSAALRCPVEVLFSEHFRQIREEVDQRRKRYNIDSNF